MVGSTGYAADCDEVGCDRRHVARRAARGRDVPPRGLRRAHRRDRRRTASPVRPAAALEGAARAATGNPISSCCASRASTTSTSTGGSTRARSRSTLRTREVELARRRTRRVRRARDRDRRHARAGCADQPDLAGLFTLRTLDDALALRATARRGDPKVVVIGAGFIGAEVAATCRGPWPRRHRARDAAAADGARPRTRARSGDRGGAPRPRRRPADRCRRSTASRTTATGR